MTVATKGGSLGVCSLFDISAAFGRVLRGRIYSAPEPVRQRLEALGLSETEVQAVINEVEANGAILGRANVPTHVQHILHAFHQVYWIQQDGSSQAIRSRRGVRQKGSQSLAFLHDIPVRVHAAREEYLA